jgi:hypothetical protein
MRRLHNSRADRPGLRLDCLGHAIAAFSAHCANKALLQLVLVFCASWTVGRGHSSGLVEPMAERWFKVQLTGLTVEWERHPHIRVDVKGRSEERGRVWGLLTALAQQHAEPPDLLARRRGPTPLDRVARSGGVWSEGHQAAVLCWHRAHLHSVVPAWLAHVRALIFYGAQRVRQVATAACRSGRFYSVRAPDAQMGSPASGRWPSALPCAVLVLTPVFLATLAFGSRLAGPMVKIAYRITPVLYGFHLKLLEV